MNPHPLFLWQKRWSRDKEDESLFRTKAQSKRHITNIRDILFKHLFTAIKEVPDECMRNQPGLQNLSDPREDSERDGGTAIVHLLCPARTSKKETHNRAIKYRILIYCHLTNWLFYGIVKESKVERSPFENRWFREISGKDRTLCVFLGLVIFIAEWM